MLFRKLLFRKLRKILLTALLASIGCSSNPDTVSLDCPEIEPSTGLTLESARETYRRAEQARMLRYREAIDPGYFIRESRKVVPQGKIDRGRVCYSSLFSVGRLLFEHEYSFADGLGRDDAKTRPDPFRKVHEGELGGPETISCTSCHWRGGPAGAGAVQDNAQLLGDGVNTSSADERNPPALLGSGVAQALAQEMSRELQAQRTVGKRKASDSGKEVVVELRSKGVEFGQLHIAANGTLDYAKVEGIDDDLVIKPFGWRGEFATIRDFVMTSTQVHLGIQSEDLLRAAAKTDRYLGAGPRNDPDNDGMTGELSAGQLTAIVTYIAGLELPIVKAPDVLYDFPPTAEGIAAPRAVNFADRFAQGQQVFGEAGCALCHQPMMILKDPIFRTKSEVTGKTLSIDLSKTGEEPRLTYNEHLGGYPVWLFSDMKRHDLGATAAGKHKRPGIKVGEYLTRRLWGLAGSPPYFYDGRATTFDAAIAAHSGEATFAREEFDSLTWRDKASLRIFLLSLRRSPRLTVP